MGNRVFLRGTSPLGLFNTVIGTLFNRVLVRMLDVPTDKTVGWFWDKATNHPQDPCDADGHKWTDWVVQGEGYTFNRWDADKEAYVYLPGIRYVRTRSCQRDNCEVSECVVDEHTVDPWA